MTGQLALEGVAIVDLEPKPRKPSARHLRSQGVVMSGRINTLDIDAVRIGGRYHIRHARMKDRNGNNVEVWGRVVAFRRSPRGVVWDIVEDTTKGHRFILETDIETVTLLDAMFPLDDEYEPVITEKEQMQLTVLRRVVAEGKVA